MQKYITAEAGNFGLDKGMEHIYSDDTDVFVL